MLTALVMAVSPAEAQRGWSPQRPDNWAKLGQQSVGFGVDRDVIQVGQQEGRFRSLRLFVKGSDIRMVEMKVIYGNGELEVLPVNRQMRAGTDTGELDLRGDARAIQQVEFVYKSRPSFRGQAVVELWGRHVNDDRRGPGRGPGPGFSGPPPQRFFAGEVPPGWVKFGAQTVGFQAERDIVRVGREAGRYRRIAIRVLRNDIFMREINVVYGRGDSDIIPINAEIAANGVTQPIDMKRDGRINEIQLVYQSKPNFRGQAVVEIYGEPAAGGSNWGPGPGQRR